MNYLERYRNGECEQVWKGLQALGPLVRREPHYAQAREVAAETMRRVRRNCERIVSRLRTLAYVFGTFPDGSGRSYAAEPLTPPPPPCALTRPNWRRRPVRCRCRSSPSGRR